MPGCRKRGPESRFRPVLTGMAGMGVLGALLAVGGCEERVLDSGPGYHYWMGYFEDQPSPPVPPSPIRRMSNTDPSYPSLYTVPMRDVPVPTLAERAQAVIDQKNAVDKMATDQRAGRSADEQLQEMAPPPLPPPPVGPDGKPLPGQNPAGPTAAGGTAPPGAASKPVPAPSPAPVGVAPALPVPPPPVAP